MTAKRPVMRYHGGKWLLAKWIIGHFPPHRVYVEPFGGAASVLIRKVRSYGEVYNDLSGEIVNVFRVLRDREQAAELISQIRLTPFSRAEYEASYEAATDPVEWARRTIFRSFAGFGSAAANSRYRTGFRSNSNRSGTTPAMDWRNYPDCLAAIVERLRGVVIEQRDAADVMRQHDGPETLHYVDPPYVHETRVNTSGKPAYRFEMSDDDHRNLAKVLRTLSGMVILSGYRCPLYDELFGSWVRVDRAARGDRASVRTESIWMNRAAVERSGLLFQGTAE